MDVDQVIRMYVLTWPHTNYVRVSVAFIVEPMMMMLLAHCVPETENH